jgi:hypothetical protein
MTLPSGRASGEETFKRRSPGSGAEAYRPVQWHETWHGQRGGRFLRPAPAAGISGVADLDDNTPYNIAAAESRIPVSDFCAMDASHIQITHPEVVARVIFLAAVG